MNTKYTSNGNNKWGLVSGGASLEYERVTPRNGCAIALFLIPAILIILAIVLLSAGKAHAESSRLNTAGNCNGQVNHDPRMIYLTGSYTCQYAVKTLAKADNMIPEETSLPVKGMPAKIHHSGNQSAAVANQPVVNQPITSQGNQSSNSDNTDNKPATSNVHPNDGRGNGSELDSNGNDLDAGNSDKNKGGD